MSTIVRVLSLLGTGVLVQAGAQSRATNSEDYRCNYEARYLCTKTGCKSVLGVKELGAQYVLVPSLRALRRAASIEGAVEIRLCDGSGCTPVSMHASEGGDYLYLTAANRATQYMKIYASSFQSPTVGQISGHRQGDFSEVEDVMLVTIVGYGRCESK
jgi:hypothetical protein